MRRKQAKRELIKDFVLILSGILIAIFLSHIGFIHLLVNSISNQILSSFFAGIFFTSIFTLAPASIALVNISDAPIHLISFWGAVGALCGDLILFFFIRDRFANDLMQSIRPSVARNILNSFHLGFMKWLSPILGAFIIASPLPDEIGLTLLGISKTRISVLIPISFCMNYIGIYVLLYIAGLAR